MDGLDIYIDDYSKPDPIPESMLRNMVSAQFLKLFEADDKDEETVKAAARVRDDAYNPDVQSVAQSYENTDIATPPTSAAPASPLAALEPGDTTSHHAHTDLRLQPDHAPAAPRAGRGAE